MKKIDHVPLNNKQISKALAHMSVLKTFLKSERKVLSFSESVPCMH